MKNKLLIVVLTLVIILCGCEIDNKLPKTETLRPVVNDSTEMRAIWISYYDYDFSGLTKAEVKRQVELILDNISSAKFNNVFLHVRANADAIYPSEYFPFSQKLTGVQGADPGYDLLQMFIDAAHDRSIKIHAWINPYRISNTSDDINSLCDGHIAKKWANDQNYNNCVISHGGKLYFNPASVQVQELVLNGVKEILKNYKIDGIHFDDYFYPVSDEAFDKIYYYSYVKNTVLPLSHLEWRTANVSVLVQAVHRITKENNILFGVSPSAHIDNDYLQKNGYVDVEKWIATDQYVDYILPQIYWGFEYPAEEYRFDTMIKKWKDIARHENVRLYVGLASYKSGTEDQGDEWIKNNDILMRQILLQRDLELDGFSVFSYSSFFSESRANTLERMNYLTCVN